MLVLLLELVLLTVVMIRPLRPPPLPRILEWDLGPELAFDRFNAGLHRSGRTFFDGSKKKFRVMKLLLGLYASIPFG
ncbi:hypothetical protein [Nitrospirillum viridazoti]|uniref:hypothetical protein n=1 Tax=Nitrospirillum viridazoti TaxID=3144925 RepID=UPI00110F9C52|nr:hypothetical protein [Nitrospirillum amazonense]